MERATRFASRTAGMGANAIREILKVTGQPGMRSLAGGIPGPGLIRSAGESRRCA
ncbi:MAG: hypothetical protein ACLFR8_04665 [Alkalispirochaeta sp.]